VDFNVQEGGASRNGRPNAVRVRVLPRGTLRPPAPPPPPAREPREAREAREPREAAPSGAAGADISAVRYTGRIVRELRGGQRSRGDAYGARLSYTPGAPGAGPAAQLDFAGADVAEGTPAARLRVGEEVTFAIATDRATGEQRATAVQATASGAAGDAPAGGAAPPAPATPAAASASAAASAGPPGSAAAAAASAGREVGRVAQLRDTFGFVRVSGGRGAAARLFFHFSQLEGVSERQLSEGSEVSFLVAPDRRTGKTTAQALRALPPGSLAPETGGRGGAGGGEEGESGGGNAGGGGGGAAPSRSDAASWARTTPLPPPAPPPGHAQAQAHDANDAAAAAAEAALHSASGYRAAPAPPAPRNAPASSSASAAASSASSSSLPRELGAVVVLKDSYGFIKCCERPVDLFFHFSALVDASPETLITGLDVEFSVIQDGRAGKPIATRVTLAPKGAAVFENVAAERLRGVCRERLPSGKASYAPRTAADGAQQAPPAPHEARGSIEYTPGGGALAGTFVFSDAPPPPRNAPPPPDAAAADAPSAPPPPPPPASELLPFGRGDVASAAAAPRPGDAVEFSIVTDRRTGARRAARVTLLRRTGTVVSVKPAYGFLEVHPEAGDVAAAGGPPAGGAHVGRPARVFFHASEVEGGASLRERDEAEFVICVNAKTHEPNARKLRRTREAPTAPPARPERAGSGGAGNGGGGDAAGGGGERPEREKGAMVVHRTTRMAEGPDGTPGFGMGRGKVALAYGTQSALRVSATPFVMPAAGDGAGAAQQDAGRTADAEE
jgi:cold shock CspA family protein